MEAKPDRDILLDALLEHSADHIYFKDTEGRFICASRSLARWFGVPNPEALIGKSDRDFFASEHARQAADDEAMVMLSRRPIEGIIEKETWPNGDVTWVSTSKLPLFDRSGNLIGIQGISRDVTAQHRANEELARLAREQLERNNAYEQDVKLAAEVFEIFGSSLPEHLPIDTDSETAKVQCASYYLPSGALGGDFYLLLPQPNNGIRLLVCDVMGHGMQAALVAVLLRTWAQLMSPTHPDPTKWMRALNHRLSESFISQGMAFISTVVAIDMDLVNGLMRMVCAGHPTPLLYTGKDRKIVKLFPLSETGPALGLMPHSIYHSIDANWMPGDKLLLYTDGLIEGPDECGEEFQERRLIEQFAACGNLSPSGIINNIITAARIHCSNHTFTDDVCVIAMERK